MGKRQGGEVGKSTVAESEEKIGMKRKLVQNNILVNSRYACS